MKDCPSDYLLFKKRLQIFAALWAFLAAKCYLLEYWVDIYNIPVETRLYVWSLSLIMGGFTTISFILKNHPSCLYSFINEHSTKIWMTISTLSVATLILKVSGLAVESLPIEGGLAALFTFGYFSHGIASPSLEKIIRALAWIPLTAFMLKAQPPDHYLIFSASLVILIAAPELIHALFIRRKIKKTSMV